MPLTRRRLLAGLSCVPLVGCEFAGSSAPRELSPPTPPTPPPTPPEPDWLSALGPLEDLGLAERAAFLDPHGFSDMRPQRPGDWRSVRPELPQTVAEFLAEAPHPRVAPRDRLALLPLGRYPVDVLVGPDFVGLVRAPPLAHITALLAAFFATATDLLPAEPLPDTRVPWREIQGHRQFDARALLSVVASRLPARAYGMLTMVTADLFAATDQQYTFGWSTFHDRLAVIGIARFDPSFFGGIAPDDPARAVLQRGLRVAVHEVGHLFGLAHCQAFRCAMNGVAHLDELDGLPLHLCPLCLRKLHLVTGLDLRERDEALARVFRSLGLADDAHWQDARIHRLWRGKAAVSVAPAS